MLGEEGNDRIYGGFNRDLVIGGLGSDLVDGEGLDDILVGGTTDHDANDVALLALLMEWKRTDLDIDARIDHLRNGGGLNGAITLKDDAPGQTVHDDGEQDTLVGGTGQDWFLGDPAEWLDHGGLDRP